MREQTEILSEAELSDVELNEVNGGFWFDFSMRGTGLPLWEPLTTNWGSYLVLA